MNHELLPVALEALEAARQALPRQSRRVIDTKSSATDPVTAADRALEQAIRATIATHRPTDIFVGEEYGTTGEPSATRWIVDPIDGTVNYSYSIPSYAISIAAEVDGSIDVGLVYDVGHGELFKAVRGQGATCNDVPIRVSQETDLAKALIATGFGYLPQNRRLQARVLGEMIDEIRDIRRFGAAAIDICWTAAGRVDGYFETGLKVWDWAAASLIASEAGATVTTDLPGIGDDPLTVVAGEGLFTTLRSRVSDLYQTLTSEPANDKAGR
ncbi:MAG: inositol monophosphatase family protein [Ferrimicrobium sp.]|uniref:Inositol-1-monophosphatase n=1 Tax=Ferrimicrobium acidiphilum TaxID=121039 RepID=A0ABV3XYE5_9ACTN|nr:inositol monophosphatase family protein [Ferrimicrobium sp.]MCL5973655.1 inositol monophosphatase [Actinomycetota bacterium]